MSFIERIMEQAADDGAKPWLLKRFAEVAAVLAPFVPESKDVAYAALVREDGDPSICVHSLATHRGLTVKLGISGDVTLSRIDDNNKLDKTLCPLKRHDFLAAAMRWCIGGNDWPDIEATSDGA